MELLKLYEQLTAETGVRSDSEISQPSTGRTKFLYRAEDIAKLTIPSIEPRGIALYDVAYSHEGAQAIRGLASQVRKVLMPPNRTWFKLQLTNEVKEAVIEKLQQGNADPQILNNVEELIRAEMLKGEKAINAYLHRRKVKSRIARAITRNLIEGFNVIRVLKDQINIFPLRTIAAFRQHGELKFYILKEEAAIDAKTFEKSSEGVNLIFTLVDPVNGEVWQSKNDGEASMLKPDEIDGGDYRQYVAFNSEMPDTEQYPDSFGWTFITLFNELDALVTDLGEAAANAAWAVLGLRQSSSLTASEVTEWKSGSVHKFDSEEIGWLKSDTKLNDFGMVNTRLESLQEERRRIFGAGVRDRPPGDVTATQILQEAEELDEQTADMLVNYDETLLNPLATAVAVVEGLNMVEIPGGGSAVEAVITTGNSALQRQISMMRMLQAMGVIQTLDRELYNRQETFKLVSEVEGFDEFTDNVLNVQEATEPIVEPSETTAPEESGPPVAGSIRPTAGGPQPEPSQEVKQQQNEGRLVTSRIG